VLRVDRAARADETASVPAFISEIDAALRAGEHTDLVFPARRVGALTVSLRGEVGLSCALEIRSEDGAPLIAKTIDTPSDDEEVLDSGRNYFVRCADIADFTPVAVAIVFAERTVFQIQLPYTPAMPKPVMPPMTSRPKMLGADQAFAGQTLLFDVANVLDGAGQPHSVKRWLVDGSPLQSCGTSNMCAVATVAAGTLRVEAELEATGVNGEPVIATTTTSLLTPPGLEPLLASDGFAGMNSASARGGRISIDAADPTPDGASLISTALPSDPFTPPFALDDGRPRCTVMLNDTACSDLRVTLATLATSDAPAVNCDPGATLMGGPVLDVLYDSNACALLELTGLVSSDVRVRFGQGRKVSASMPGDGLFVATGGHVWIDSAIEVSIEADAAGIVDSDSSPTNTPDHRIFTLDAGADKTVWV